MIFRSMYNDYQIYLKQEIYYRLYLWQIDCHNTTTTMTTPEDKANDKQSEAIINIHRTKCGDYRQR